MEENTKEQQTNEVQEEKPHRKGVKRTIAFVIIA